MKLPAKQFELNSSATGLSDSSDASRSRDERIRQLLLSVSHRRRAGESLSDQDVIAQHQDLLPDLEGELNKLQRIQAALRGTDQGPRTDSDPDAVHGIEGFAAPESDLSSDSVSAAGRAGGLSADSSRGILTDSQLEAPIVVSADEEDDSPAPAPAPFVPPTIAGYETIREIGRGGQAVVIEARQQSTGQRVAIKVLRGGPLVTARERILFDREVHVLASLRQRNVVGIIDRGTTKEGWSYLVMEFVDGQTLDRYAQECRRQTANVLEARRRLVAVFLKVLAAVQAAHNASVIHRDLKPSNILVDADGEPHILDFGLAHLNQDALADGTHASQMTHTGHFVGSLPYASPEQATGNAAQLNHRSDLYSLGVILYQMITGAFPYDVSGPMWTVVNHIRTAAPQSFHDSQFSSNPGRPSSKRTSWTVRRLWPKTSDRDLEAIVFKALAKAPDHRYASAAELIADLRHWMDGAPVSAGKRRLPLRALAASLALLAITVSVIAATRYWPERHAAPQTVSILAPEQSAIDLPAFGRTHAATSTRVQVTPLDLPRFTNSIGMTMVTIPAGDFVMGSPPSEYLRETDEVEHSVHIAKAFALSMTEVTQHQYELVLGALPAKLRERGDDFPVTNVNWDDAVEFCKKLSAKEGRIYRLPTEAEWEYACRAGTKGPYAGTGELTDMAWFAENQRDHLVSVAGRLPNQWGLYGMHGLVWEWCADIYGPYLAAGEAPPSNQDPNIRVARGGGYNSLRNECRSANRQPRMSGTASPSMGLRVATDLAEPQPASENSSSQPTATP